MSTRSAVALQRGVDEAMLDAVDDYEHSTLEAQHRAALELADSYLTSPAATTDEVRQRIADHLDPTQVVEVVLKLMGFSSDKVMVALGLDLETLTRFEM